MRAEGRGKDEGYAGEREVARRCIGVKWHDSRQRRGLLWPETRLPRENTIEPGYNVVLQRQTGGLSNRGLYFEPRWILSSLPG